MLPVSCKGTDMPGEKEQHQAPVDDGRRRGFWWETCCYLAVCFMWEDVKVRLVGGN